MRYNGYINMVSFTAMPFDLGPYMEKMVEALLAQSVKILYGWMVWACLLFIAVFLVWDQPTVRRRVKRMPAWSTVGVWSLRSVVKGGEMTKKGIKKVFR